jgi:hypothetical protein
MEKELSMKIILFCTLCILTLAVVSPPVVSSATQVVYQQLKKPGEKVPLDSGNYFIYGFDKQPKLGTAIMRVEIFSSDGKRDTSFNVKGDADMPSMRGAHSSGDVDFSLSAKGVYLLPVKLVMPGDWELRFTFMKKGKAVYRGAYLFDL